MELADRVADRVDELTASEHRIADTILGSPHVVAFGTVADVAAATGVGTATVVRFAVKLGYAGYAEMQASVRRDLARQLRPAADRIRDTGRGRRDDRGQRHLDIELDNVRRTLAAVSPDGMATLVGRLSDQRRPVLVVSGDASTGVALQFAGDLGQLRPGVELLTGNEVAVQRRLASVEAAASLVVVDVRRYDRWVLDAVTMARREQLWVAAITDSVVSPLARAADQAFVVAVGSVGPFDGHVGTLALLDLVVVEVAAARRGAATRRLERFEAAWRSSGALSDG